MENNANVNAMTAMGRTPLMYAAEQGNMNCVLLLLDHGANHVLGDKVKFLINNLSCSLASNYFEFFYSIAK